MSKQMIVNANAAEEVRVAILENGALFDFDVENQNRTKHRGNIYKGIVSNIEDSLEAAFIEFGDEKQAFLPLSEVRPSLIPEELRHTKNRRISDILKRGQEIIVQVTKDEIGSKGAAVTTYLSIPGRYVVLMHSDESGGGVSRKIEDEQARRQARDVLSRIAVPEGMAVIIRTAGMGRPKEDLYRDLRALCRVWETIDRGAQLGRAPTLLYREPDLVLRTIRDYLAPDIEKIIIDSEDEHQEVLKYFEERMPDLSSIVERYQNKLPIFDYYSIERSVDELHQRQVRLPSGGYIVIDPTEALVSIDVNSGQSTQEEDHEATVYKTNLEAAYEIARQLRLRDLGGIIVVDFIDMLHHRHDRDVERALRDAMRSDKARVKISRISENGILEMTRQRLRQAHHLVSYAPCSACNGTGITRDPEGQALSALRQIESRIARAGYGLARLTVRLPLAVANTINTLKRRELLELSEKNQIILDVQADPHLVNTDIAFDEERRGKAGIDAATSRDTRLDRFDADLRRTGGKPIARGKRGKRDEGPLVPLQNMPPPSIGPVPIFLAEEPETPIETTDTDGETLVIPAERVADKAERTDKPERSERAERTERTERVERNERTERNERFERPERDARPERGERNERFERPERNERFEKYDDRRPPRAPYPQPMQQPMPMTQTAMGFMPQPVPPQYQVPPSMQPRVDDLRTQEDMEPIDAASAPQPAAPDALFDALFAEAPRIPFEQAEAPLQPVVTQDGEGRGKKRRRNRKKKNGADRSPEGNLDAADGAIDGIDGENDAQDADAEELAPIAAAWNDEHKHPAADDFYVDPVPASHFGGPPAAAVAAEIALAAADDSLVPSTHNNDATDATDTTAPAPAAVNHEVQHETSSVAEATAVVAAADPVDPVQSVVAPAQEPASAAEVHTAVATEAASVQSETNDATATITPATPPPVEVVVVEVASVTPPIASTAVATAAFVEGPSNRRSRYRKKAEKAELVPPATTPATNPQETSVSETVAPTNVVAATEAIEAPVAPAATAETDVTDAVKEKKAPARNRRRRKTDTAGPEEGSA